MARLYVYPLGLAVPLSVEVNDLEFLKRCIIIITAALHLASRQSNRYL